MSNSNSNGITIAIIGLIGATLTAVLSNWEKIFSKKNEVRATFSGYRATGIFETELRYFFEVSGYRKSIEDMQQQTIYNTRLQLISQYPEDADCIDSLLNGLLDEAPTLDEVIRSMLPIYQKFFSVEELQELNKFYSTEIMQNMIKKRQH